MNMEKIMNCSDVYLRTRREELIKNLSMIDEELDRRHQEALKQVEVTKIGNGHFILKHPVFGEFEAKNVAHVGRYRVWRRVAGVRGTKRGEVVVNESLYGINHIREQICKHGFAK
jgi:hypothetical protein